MLEVQNLTKIYLMRRGILTKEELYAVDDISFKVSRGEIFGLAGESGSGKTTTGRLITRLEEPTKGKIIFNGVNITNLFGKKLKDFRKAVQMIFQDPYASLNPRYTVWRTLYEPLLIHGIGSRKEREQRILDILDKVGLQPPQQFLGRYPFELSGGQRQRVALARALILEPEFIVADEPISMLDLSVGAVIMDLMLKLKERFKTTYLFITHDLAASRYLCNRIAIMYRGKILEIGPAEDVISNSHNPYTRMLLSAVPVPDPTFKRQRASFSIEAKSLTQLDKGCRFSTRCPYAKEICMEHEPKLIKIEKDHLSACHFAHELF